MIDPLSCIGGIFIGLAIGLLVGVFKYGQLLDQFAQLRYENIRLMQERTARGPGGRYIRKPKP